MIIVRAKLFLINVSFEAKYKNLINSFHHTLMTNYECAMKLSLFNEFSIFDEYRKDILLEVVAFSNKIWLKFCNDQAQMKRIVQMKAWLTASQQVIWQLARTFKQVYEYLQVFSISFELHLANPSSV